MSFQDLPRKRVGKLKTLDEWNGEKRKVRKGEKAQGKNAQGKALFHKSQTDPKPRKNHNLPTEKNDYYSRPSPIDDYSIYSEMMQDIGPYDPE